MPLRIDRRLVERYTEVHHQALTVLERGDDMHLITADAKALWATMNSAEKGLAAQLCDDAYDVWLGGQRSA